METKKPKRKKRTPAEKILHEARLNPSPFCKDPRQISFLDYAKSQGFAALDRAIADTLK
jgi:hypothetical protein